jgi:hypothetical protein
MTELERLNRITEAMIGAAIQQVAEKRSDTVILSAAKNLALSTFNDLRDSSFASLRTACGSSE